MSSNHDLKERYKCFILKLASEITVDTLGDLKYRLSNYIGAGKMESLRRPLDLLIELEKSGIIGPQNLSKLRGWLISIQQHRLASMVENFEHPCGLWSSKIIQRPKNENCLTMDGYNVDVMGGQHFETDGGELVELRSGQNYAIVIRNRNWHRCVCKIKIDGHVVFREFVVDPNETVTLKRTAQSSSNLKFFATEDAPPGSGIDKSRVELNGLVEVKFTQERADMKIWCYVNGAWLFSLECSSETTAAGFHRMILSMLESTVTPIAVYFGIKPIGQRPDIKLTDYGICHGSRVEVNYGMAGGGIFLPTQSEINDALPKWIPGATTLAGESGQTFGTNFDFEPDLDKQVTLRLRLVAREGVIPGPSNGEVYTPLARETPTPPPVRQW